MTFRRTRAPPKSRAWRQATNSGTIDRPYDRVSAPSPPSQRRSRPHAPEASITTRASNRGSRPEALQLCPRRWGRSASWARAPSGGRSRRRPWRRHHRPVLELSTARGLHRLVGERGGTACLRSGGSGPGIRARRSGSGGGTRRGTSCPCTGRREQARGRVVTGPPSIMGWILAGAGGRDPGSRVTRGVVRREFGLPRASRSVR